uniref:HSF-type DNA-binding domain-containing protein n=2 Tax=Pseudo-nitzschia australis TaxID=44445 RepID=A0A7S4ER40_9STRA|mmetsp:Transcript_7932/g.17049  ORF Transcript_7932/g.17049 Transcript_7932/m.17049 type:complete len:365 (-) Transcript_7932:252-1346(-)
MSPSAERDSTNPSRNARSLGNTMASCHDSSSSLDDQNDRGRSIAKGGVTTPFPWKLHIMLDAMDETGDKSIVCWQPHGRAFMVHKPKDFVLEVMPHFFNQTKYASFQRQLNLYGFSRLTHGPDKGAYYHNCFVRGKRHLCKGMIRQKIKGTKVRKSLSPEDEPNFYTMSPTDVFIPPAKVRQEDMESTGQSSSLQSWVDESPNPLKSSSSEESSVSYVSIAPLDSFQTKSSTISLSKPPGGINRTRKSHDSNCELLSNNIKPLSTSRIVSPQHYNDKWEVLEEVKGGDLLFFEGQPFRYLEHFEEVPANQQLTIAKRSHYSQTTRDAATTSTDVFQDRISKIILGMDSSRPFQNDVMQNMPCSA